MFLFPTFLPFRPVAFCATTAFFLPLTTVEEDARDWSFPLSSIRTEWAARFGGGFFGIKVGVYVWCELEGVGVELSGERLSSNGCGARVRGRLTRGGLSAVDERAREALPSLAMSDCDFFCSFGFSHLGPGSLTQPSST